jgi:UbiD family decarboxylase
VVIEGRIPLDKNEKILEGPMAEYTDTYASNEPQPFIQVTAITHRKDALFHVLLSGRSREHATGGMFVGLGWADYFLTRVRGVFPSVKDASLLAGSHGCHLVVCLEQRYNGEDKQLLHYLMGTTRYKFITIVDEDIDPHNCEEVEWARNMRAGKNPDDYVIVPKSRAYDLDPCKDEEDKVSRLGILATLPFGEKYVRTGPPPEWLEKTRKAFEEELGVG